MSKLRNNGIITESDYQGKTIQDAKKYAEDGGFITRITQEDGNIYAVEMDYRSDRLNFSIQNGKVINVHGG